MIDSHCHLADDAFAADLEAVVSRAREAGLAGALCVLAAGDANEATRADRVGELWPAVRFAIGVHPHQAGQFVDRPDEAVALVRSAIGERPAIRAVGEIGLDYHYDFAPRAVQRELFRAQIRLARALGLPVVIHTREADEDTLAIVESEGSGEVAGVLHCFTGDSRMADRAFALGLHLSFAGILTFPRAASLREVAKQAPLERLLSETDSPYLAPVPHRGKRNEPAWVARVVDALAEIRGTSRDRIAVETSRNFAALFHP